MTRLLPLLGLLLLATPARADDARVQLVIKDHRFTPAEVHIPANQAAVIEVRNDDATAEEFESTALGVEKVIAGGRSLPVRIRAMAPGSYPFVGEYHADTAKGVVIVDPVK